MRFGRHAIRDGIEHVKGSPLSDRQSPLAGAVALHARRRVDHQDDVADRPSDRDRSMLCLNSCCRVTGSMGMRVDIDDDRRLARAMLTGLIDLFGFGS